MNDLVASWPVLNSCHEYWRARLGSTVRMRQMPHLPGPASVAIFCVRPDCPPDPRISTREYWRQQLSVPYQASLGSAHPPARRGTRARRHYVECHPRGHPRRRKFQATRKFAKTHARVIPAVVSRCSKDVARNIAALCHPATYWLTGSVLQVGGGENIVGWSHDGR